MKVPVKPPARSIFFGINELHAFRALRRPGVSVVVTSPASVLEEVVLLRQAGADEVLQVHKEGGADAAFVVTSWEEAKQLRLRHRIRMVSPDLKSVIVNLHTILIAEAQRRR